MSKYLFADGSRKGYARKGVIYAAQEDGTPLVKIGTTSGYVNQRIVELSYQYKCAFSLVASVDTDDQFWIESCIHRLLTPSRIWGEFFYLHMSQRKLEEIVAEAREMIDREIEAQRQQIRLKKCERAERQQIREILTKDRERHVSRIGRIAYSYGLYTYDDAILHGIFATVASPLTVEKPDSD